MTKSGKWSLHYDCCVSCGTTDRPYKAWGCCTLCYDHEYRHADRRAEFARVRAESAERSKLIVGEYMGGLTASDIGGLRGFKTPKVRGILHRAGIGKVGSKNQRMRATSHNQGHDPLPKRCTLGTAADRARDPADSVHADRRACTVDVGA